MHEEAAMSHFDAAVLADYLDLVLTEDEELQIEEHLALCRDCTSTVRRQRRVSDVLDGWTARAHGLARRAGLESGE
jgi:predicted anti-sigma-YlaC factor YlaD